MPDDEYDFWIGSIEACHLNLNLKELIETLQHELWCINELEESIELAAYRQKVRALLRRCETVQKTIELWES